MGKDYAGSHKEVYKLRPKDFIPIVGVRNHRKRCLEAISKNQLLGDRYAGECAGRNILLGLYNLVIIAGAVYASLGLAGVFNK